MLCFIECICFIYEAKVCLSTFLLFLMAFWIRDVKFLVSSFCIKSYLLFLSVSSQIQFQTLEALVQATEVECLGKLVFANSFFHNAIQFSRITAQLYISFNISISFSSMCMYRHDYQPGKWN